MKRAIIIVGPTAVGKTDLAFKISKVFPSLLISADSVQVYRGANIISGKENSVKTYLLDVVSPYSAFSVRDFVEKVKPLVKKAKKENKLPIIVGGTGFYIDVLIKKIDTILIPPNISLRKKLEKLSVNKLQEKLSLINRGRFEGMNNSDVNNRRRLIRAIEVAMYTGMIDHTPKVGPIFSEDETLIIGLRTSNENLRKRIIARVENRIKIGALDEAKKLFKNYPKLSPQLKLANGYKDLFEYLSGELAFDEAKKSWVVSEIQNACDQMKWFMRNKNIVWFDIEKPDFFRDILSLIKET